LILRLRNRHPKKKQMGPKTGRKTCLPQFADLQLCTKVVTFILYGQGLTKMSIAPNYRAATILAQEFGSRFGSHA
jgi:hypothetical protein